MEKLMRSFKIRTASLVLPENKRLPKMLLLVALLIAACGLNLLTEPLVVHAASQVVTNCADDTQLRGYLANGGIISFNCASSTTTIALSNTLNVTKNTVIDGSGQQITLSGNNSYQVLSVNGGVSLTISNLTIANGKVAPPSNISNQGGGLANNGGTVTISNSTFANNTVIAASGSSFGAIGQSAQGGAIYNSGTLTVTNSTFTSNIATGGNGFYANAGSAYGGAIYNKGILVLKFSTLSGNTVNVGQPGIGGAAGLIYGGNLYEDSNATYFKVDDSIIANPLSSTSSGTVKNCSGTITDSGYNLEYGGVSPSCGFNNNAKTGDPKLNALANNGGPTQTMALSNNSAAMDAASDVACAAAPINDLDQRGFTRPFGTHCDIGAFELSFPTLVLSFAPSTLVAGNVTTLSIAITNTTGLAISNVSFSDSLPTQLSYFGTPTNNCGGTVSNSATSLTASNINLANGGTCTITVGVTGTQTGSYTNTVSNFTSAQSGTIAPVSANLTVAAGAATTFSFANVPASAVAGNAFSLTLNVYDAYGNLASGYVGTIHFSSSDAQAVLPADYTFKSGDNGSHNFNSGMVLKTAGSQNVTATDTVNSTLSANSGSILVTANSFSRLHISGPTVSITGQTFSVVVSATDAYNNLVVGYNGTAQFSSSDTLASLPANYTFNNSDNGVHTFINAVNLRTVGNQTISVADTVVSNSSGSLVINVNTNNPATITAVSSLTQTKPINTAFAFLQVLVLNTANTPVTGATVTFAVFGNGAGASFSGSTVVTATTDNNGLATSPLLTANNIVGSYNVSASASGAVSPVIFSLSNTAGNVAAIAVASGSPQSSVVSSAFNSPLVAVVRDSGGNGIAGASVTFTAPANVWQPGGTFAGSATAIVTTDANGLATAPVLTANSISGSFIVTATVGGVATPASFYLISTAGPTAAINPIIGSLQSAAFDHPFAEQLQAAVTDAGGNPIENIVVTFTAPASSASGIFTPTNSAVVTATTNAAGIATAPVFVANETLGTYTVTVSTDGTYPDGSYSQRFGSRLSGKAVAIAEYQLTNVSTVLGITRLGTNISHLSFQSAAGNGAIQQSISLNSYTARILWNSRINYGPNAAGWLTISPITGTVVPLVPVSLQVTANPTRLATGIYTATLTFADAASFNDNASVTITLLVGDLYTYNLPFLANNANGYSGQVVIQNSGEVAANLSLQYFDSQGNLLVQSTNCSSLAAHAGCTALNPFTFGSGGAASLLSDQPLNVLVTEQTPFGGSAYPVAAGANSRLIAPLAINQANNFSTQLTVFNTADVATTATINFYDQRGNALPSATRQITMPAHAAQTIDQAASNLPVGYYGWAEIDGADGSQLSAQVLEQNAALHFVALTPAQAIASSNKLYAPAIFNQAFGNFVTGANIVNPNAASVQVTITYYDNNGKAYLAAPFMLAAHAVVPIFQGSKGGQGLPDGGLPLGFYGSAEIASSSPVAMVVNESGGFEANNIVRSGVYLAATSATNRVGLPLVANAGNGYTSGATILNIGDVAITANISYYNSVGALVAVSPQFTIAPHSSQPVYQGADANLPAGFYGQAIINQIDGSGSNLAVTTNVQSDSLFFTYTENSPSQ